MNKTEKDMLELLKRLRDEYSAVSVKAEFEAEGTRTDELLRLIDIARRADLKIALKIGGCEAVRDLQESKQIGVDTIIAPMVETPYALQKYIEAKNKVYSPYQQQYTQFLYNLETVTTFKTLHEMAVMAGHDRQLQGIVFGRVDFCGSLGISRQDIDTAEITQYVLQTAEVARNTGLHLVVGGAVSISSLPELMKIKQVHLSRFETRKVIFDATALDNPQLSEGLKHTVNFELQWLKNKQNYYQQIQNEDSTRIQMLEQRWHQLNPTL